MDLNIGSAAYRLTAVQRDGAWCAHAARAHTGERFGIEVTADAEQDAIERLTLWLEWQHQHMQALDALQQAERTYHRAIAGAAFAAPSDDGSGNEQGRASLESLDRARTLLDDVRARRPVM